MSSITLNDFRNVLGRVNDGDVIVTDDNKLQKVNFGGKMRTFFGGGNRMALESLTLMNKKVIDSFMAALANSAELGNLSETDRNVFLARCRRQLGLDGEHPEYRPLNRRTISTILSALDVKCASAGNLVKNAIANLKAGGLYNRERSNDIIAKINTTLGSHDGAFLTRSLPRHYNGKSRDAIAKFVDNNARVLRAMTYDRMYFDVDGEKPMGVEKAFRESIDALMASYAKNEMPLLRSATLGKTFDEVQVNAEVKPLYDQLEDKSLEKNVADLFGAKEGSYGAAFGGRVARAVTNTLRHAFNDAYVSSKGDHVKAQEAYQDMCGMLRKLVDAFNVGQRAFARACGDEDASAAFLRLFADMNASSDISKASEKQLASTLVGTLQSLARASTDFLAARYVLGEHPELKQDECRLLVDKMTVDLDARTPRELEDHKVAVFRAILADVDAPETMEAGCTLVLSGSFEKAQQSRISPEKLLQMKKAAIDEIVQALMNGSSKRESPLVAKRDIATASYGWGRLEDEGVVKDSKLIADPKNPNDLKAPPTFKNAEKKLDDLLEAMSLDDIRFCGKYAELGMADKDVYIARKVLVTKQGLSPSDAMRMNEPEVKQKGGATFYDGLKDGVIDIADLDNATVDLLGDLLGVGLYDSEGEKKDAEEYLNVGDYREVYSDLGSAFNKMGAACPGFKELFLREVATVFQDKPDFYPSDKKDFCARYLKDPASMTDDLEYVVTSNEGLLLYGFGTNDLLTMLKLFKRCGLDVTKLATGTAEERASTLARLAALTMASHVHQDQIADLPEFIERCTGKPVGEFTLADACRLLSLSTEDKLADPNTKVDGDAKESDKAKKADNAKKAVDVLCSRLTFKEANVGPADVAALLAGMRTLEKEGTVTVRLLGKELTLVRRDDGAVNVKVGGKAVFRTLRDTDGLRRMVEDEMVNNAALYASRDDKELLLTVLPSKQDIETGRTTLLRARELCVKILASRLSVPLADLSSVSTERLFAITRDVVEKDVQASEIPELAVSEPSRQYNSEDMIEMHDRFVNTRAELVDAKVQMAPKPTANVDVPDSLALNRKKTVHDFVADLFLNQNTWAFDKMSKPQNGANAPAARLRDLLGGYQALLTEIRGGKSDDVFATLPVSVRDPARTLVRNLAAIDLGGVDADAQLNAIDGQIVELAQTVLGSMQDVVKEMFTPKAENVVAVDPSLKSLADIGGVRQGLDENTANGKLVKNVLDVYFIRSKPVDQRAMLAAYIRNTDSGSSKGVQVAELLKGAGPLLQKMLQGLPIETFPPETQVALKDMKSRLAPIPEDAVKAQMLELVNSSGGNILSINVKKSLGAASVGQAFLCNIKTREHPIKGEECVVKVLRPNAQTAIRREKALFDQVLDELKDPALKTMFKGQYEGILRELDFTLEAKNVETGISVYEQPKVGSEVARNVHSMQLQDGVVPTMGTMVVKCAPGKTCDTYMEDMRTEIADELRPIRHDAALVQGGPATTVYRATTVESYHRLRADLQTRHADVLRRRQHLCSALDAMFTNALFGDGFFHADLHGGNGMLSNDGVTLIDFGNCGRIQKHEQEPLRYILLDCIVGDADLMLKKHLPGILSEEGRAAFKNLDAETQKALADVLTQGSSADVLPRLFTVLTILQRRNVPIPSSVYNFIQSYNRLADVITGMDDLLEEVERTARSLELDPVAIRGPEDRQENLPKAVSLFYGAFLAQVGSVAAPPTKKETDASFKILKDYLASRDGTNELDAIFSSPETAQAALTPFIARCQTFSHRNGSQIKSVSGFSDLKTGLKALADALAGTGKDPVDKVLKSLRRKFEATLRDSAAAFEDLSTLTFPEPGESPAVVVGNAAMRGMMQIMGVSSSTSELSMIDKAGTFMNHYKDIRMGGTLLIAGMKMKLESLEDAKNLVDQRWSTAQKRLRAENDAKESGTPRLTVAEMMQIEKCVRTDFRLPSGTPFAAAGWTADKKAAALFREMLELNLSKLRAAFKIPVGTPLPVLVVRHAFGLLGAAGNQSLTLPILAENDQTALLAAFGDSSDLKDALNALTSHPTIPDATLKAEAKAQKPQEE